MSFVFPSKGLSGDSITFCSTNDNDNISVKTDEVTLPTSNARAVSFTHYDMDEENLKRSIRDFVDAAFPTATAKFFFLQLIRNQLNDSSEAAFHQKFSILYPRNDAREEQARQFFFENRVALLAGPLDEVIAEYHSLFDAEVARQQVEGGAGEAARLQIGQREDSSTITSSTITSSSSMRTTSRSSVVENVEFVEQERANTGDEGIEPVGSLPLQQPSRETGTTEAMTEDQSEDQL